MPEIDLGNIRSKAINYLNSKDGKIKRNAALSKKIKDGRVPNSPKAAGDMFVSVLRDEINAIATTSAAEIQSGGLGESAISALNRIKASSPFKVSDNIYTIEINFAGDLSRPSMAPGKYEEIHNIAALLNNGYDANKPVHGFWHGEDRWSLAKRQGANFMNSAVDAFNRQYKEKYNVIDIKLNSIYTE